GSGRVGSVVRSINEGLEIYINPRSHPSDIMMPGGPVAAERVPGELEPGEVRGEPPRAAFGLPPADRLGRGGAPRRARGGAARRGRGGDRRPLAPNRPGLSADGRRLCAGPSLAGRTRAVASPLLSLSNALSYTTRKSGSVVFELNQGAIFKKL